MLSRLTAAFDRVLPQETGALGRLFPEAAALADAAPAALMALGLTGQRARAIVALAGEVAAQRNDLAPTAPLDATLHALRALPGVGEWTVQYIAMRALGWPDAIPVRDAVLVRRLACSRPEELIERSAAWAPWPAYAVLHLWRRAETEAT